MKALNRREARPADEPTTWLSPRPQRAEALHAVGVALLAFSLALLLDRFYPGCFFRDDNVVQYIPAQAELARAWLHAELPLLSDCSWFGGALAGVYQYGIFSPVQQLLQVGTGLAVSTLPLKAACLSAMFLGVCASGFFTLARTWELPTELAVSAAITCSFSGWFLEFGAERWTPVLFSFAWIPWLWWTLEQTRWTARVWMAYVLSWAAILLAGWPFTLLMGALLTALSAVTRPSRPRLGGLASGFGLALGLASPALVFLFEHKLEALRSLGGLSGYQLSPLKLLCSLLVNVDRHGSDLPLQSSFDFNVGLLPALACGSLFWLPSSRAVFRRHPTVWLALLASVVLASSPAFGGLRWPVRWLPLVLACLSLQGHLQIEALRQQPVGLNPGLLGLGSVGWALVYLASRRASLEAALIIASESVLITLVWAVLWRAIPSRRALSTALLSLAMLARGVILQHDAMARFPVRHSIRTRPR